MEYVENWDSGYVWHIFFPIIISDDYGVYNQI